MIFYIPASFDDEDYRPSWTGNYTYPTITIRGIFDSREKAEKSIEDWRCSYDCEILERYIDDDIVATRFDIDYQNKDFDIYVDKNYGKYRLNEIVDEDYSAVYDEEQMLGVYDY